MKAEFTAMTELSVIQKEALDQLRAAVYPPEVLATLPGRFFAWAAPQWSVLLWEEDELVARVGLVKRELVSGETKRMIGGIGGVMTHPSKQGRGFASQAMRAASGRFENDLGVSYALLFCRPHLVEFYKRLSWKPFTGKVYVEQPQGKMEFSMNGPMVLDVREPAPLDGTIDLNGLPW